MPRFSHLQMDDFRFPNSQTVRFDGEAFDAGTSFFFVHNAPGKGPDLHRHDYSEVFVVLEGSARFEVDGEEVLGHPGEVLVVPPGVNHGFKAREGETLRMMCLHDTGRMTNLESQSSRSD